MKKTFSTPEPGLGLRPALASTTSANIWKALSVETCLLAALYNWLPREQAVGNPAMTRDIGCLHPLTQPAGSPPQTCK